MKNTNSTPTNEDLMRSFRNVSREYALATEPSDKNKWGGRCERAADALVRAKVEVPSLRFNLAGDEDSAGELRGY